MPALSSFVVYRKLFFSKGKNARVTAQQEAEAEAQPPSATSSFSASGSLPTPLHSPPAIVFDISPEHFGQSPFTRERAEGPIPWLSYNEVPNSEEDGAFEDDSSIAYLRDTGSSMIHSDETSHNGRPRLTVGIPPDPVISVPQEQLANPPPRPPRKRPVIPPIQIPNLVPTKPLDLRDKGTPKPTQTAFTPGDAQEQQATEEELRYYLDGQAVLGVNADVAFSFSPIPEEQSGEEEEVDVLEGLHFNSLSPEETVPDFAAIKTSRRQSRSRKTASRTASLRSLHVRPKSVLLEDGTVRTFSSEDAHMARLIMTSVLDSSQLSPSIYSFGNSDISPASSSQHSATSTNSRPFWMQDGAPPVPPMPSWFTPTDGRTPDTQAERNLDEAAPRTSTSTETGMRPPAPASLPTPPDTIQIKTRSATLPYAPTHARNKSGTVVPLPRPPTQRPPPPDFAVTAVPLELGDDNRIRHIVRFLSLLVRIIVVGYLFFQVIWFLDRFLRSDYLHDIDEEGEQDSGSIKSLQHRLSMSDKLGGPRPRGPGGPRLPGTPRLGSMSGLPSVTSSPSLRGKRMGPREPVSRRSSVSSLAPVFGRTKGNSNAERPPLPPLPSELADGNTSDGRRSSLDSTTTEGDSESIATQDNRSSTSSFPVVEEEDEKQAKAESRDETAISEDSSSTSRPSAVDVPFDVDDAQEAEFHPSYLGKASDGSTPLLQKLMSELMDGDIVDDDHADDEATDGKGTPSRRSSLRKRVSQRHSNPRPIVVHGKSHRNAVIRQGVQRHPSHRREALARSRSANLRRHASSAPRDHDPKFEAGAVAWQPYTYDDVVETLSSAELQAIVSHAIRKSGSTESIRLLPLDALGKVAEEQARLEERRQDIKGQYALLARERGKLLDDRERIQKEVEVVLDEIRGVSLALDALAEELHSVDDQISQLAELRSAHSASALSLALRKLHSSLSRQQTENLKLRHVFGVTKELVRDGWVATFKAEKYDTVQTP
ncbi:hypothetical protein BD626DRAFT_538015 [Schizophyllum amplum]|uniref:Uncharacterized protein n=1 Tax=Schizophyllum amplum TaxID=97359 RepID=A0A550CAU3_9AGAR|nr:hypothetical protein BD626DRAFT_538015 [Auriculariopsis ampla]